MNPSAAELSESIEKALRLLQDPSLTPEEIASACGFDGLCDFESRFREIAGSDPLAFREQSASVFLHDFYRCEDILTAVGMPSASFMSPAPERTDGGGLPAIPVYRPDDRLAFLHEAAIIEYHGVLYASWYNCPRKELMGYTPICGKRSSDGGKTWSPPEILAEDKTERILYCPPVYGVVNDTLYLFMNQMVAPDHIHSLDLYVLNNETGRFDFLWSKPVPFKLNTNVVALPNGKLMLPGRIAEPDGFPNTPAVLISDSGSIDTDWRLVKIAENGDLPGGKQLVHPEISVICAGDRLFMFCRNDQSRIPLVYLSDDFGESWSAAHAHDVPYVSSKIYCGDLSDGRHYMICNTERFNRSKLVLYLTADSSLRFTKETVLFDTAADTWGACHYPAACESDGKLYIIATVGYEGGARGASLFIVGL